MPATLMIASFTSTNSSILTTHHFVDEAMGTQRGQVTCPNHTAGKSQPASVAPMLCSL